MHDLFNFMRQFATEIRPDEYAAADPDLPYVDVAFARMQMLPDAHIDVEGFKRVITEHIYRGEFSNVNPLDGQPHDYIELGHWIGDQYDALRFMGVATLAGLCEFQTASGDAEEVRHRQGMGEISIAAKPEHVIITPPMPNRWDRDL